MAQTPFRRLPPRIIAYILAVVVCGAAAVIQSFAQFYVHPIGWTWTLLAVLTFVSGSATVNLPALPATVSVSETFVFTSVLLFGSAAGTLTVALDALVISCWSYRKGHPTYKILFNVCAVPLAMWIASSLYYQISPYGPLYLSKEAVTLRLLLWPLLIFTVVYYSINTWLITVAISLERQLSPFRIWKDNFLWLALNYFGGASVAALLVSYTRDLDYTYLVIIVPLVLVLYFTFSTSMGRVEDANRHLSQLNALYMSTIETLAMAIDAKDQITHGHIRRVQSYAVGLAKAMGVRDEPLIRAVEAAALLHDMGKLAVPEYILNKPGPLTPAEFEKMKLHASVGADILSAIDFPYPVVPIVRHHHENWDGTGYPDRLAGAEIPIGARILSVVDCYDALTSDRPYRPRLSDKEAIRILLERRGTMYDPLVVDSFIRVHNSIEPSAETIQAPPLNAITAAASLPQTVTKPRAARLEEIAASSDEMLTLFELAQSLTTSASLQDAADLIAKHLRRLVPSSACVFFVYDVEQDDLRAAHVLGEYSALIKGLRVPIGQRLSGWVAAHRQTVRNSDPVLDLGESARAMAPRPRSCLSTPMVVGKTLVGVLSLYSSNKDAYSEDHERIIEIVARQVAPAIAETHQSERERLTVLRDRGTGLPNLRRLIEFLHSQVSPFRHPFSLVAVRFVSDDRSFDSEQEFDQVVGLLRRAMRPADLLFRTEPEELMILLLNTDRSATLGLVTKIEAALTTAATTGMTARCVLGIACAPSDGSEADELLRIARQSRPRSFESRAEPPEAIH
jgi:putative nucleotidyltransferase with HDIG domain